MFRSCLLKGLCLLLALELSAGRTVTTHRETKVDPSGRKYTKVWTTYDEEPPTDHDSDAEPVLDDPFRSFHNPYKQPSNFPNDDDVEMLPSSFGGHQFPPDDNSFMSKSFNTEVLQEVMRTKKPVVTTTNDPDGSVRTTTYKLEPDGSISMKTLVERKPTITRHHWLQTKPRPRPMPKEPKEDPWADFNNQFEWPTPSRYPVVWASPEDTETAPHTTPTSTTSTSTTTTTTTTTTEKPVTSTTQKPKVSTTPNPPPKVFLKTTTELLPLEEFLKKTTTPLPSLEDFLKSKYGKDPPRPSENSPKPPTTLQLEDLPITAVLSNGMPMHPADFAKSLNVPQQHTRVHSLTQNVNTSSTPKINDLEPDMQDMLRRAGITADELESTNGDITKTRTEPDGRVVTTRYKVRKMPAFPQHSSSVPRAPLSPNYPEIHSSGSRAGVKFPLPFVPLDYPKKNIIDSSEMPSTFGNNYPRPAYRPSMTPFMASFKNPIDDFLALLNLSSANILSLHNGDYKQQIADDQGRVLTMHLVLSLPMESHEEEVKPLPNK